VPASQAWDDPTMRRLLVFLLLAVPACAPPLQTSTFLQGNFAIPEELITTEVPDREMRYLLWFPDGYVRGDDLPLVVFLHGSGDDDYDSRWLTAYGLPAVVRFESVPSDRPFVVLAPQASPGTSWDLGRQPATVMALIDAVLEAHDLSADRVVLTGLSMGGYGVWHLATRHPDRFVRAASLSGSGYGSLDLPEGLDVCGLGSVDLRAYHGADDMISLLDLNRLVVEAWEERCGQAVDFRVIEDAGHFEAFDRTFRDPDFYEWLLTG
jgi:predicted peptidase